MRASIQDRVLAQSACYLGLDIREWRQSLPPTSVELRTVPGIDLRCLAHELLRGRIRRRKDARATYASAVSPVAPPDAAPAGTEADARATYASAVSPVAPPDAAPAGTEADAR